MAEYNSLYIRIQIKKEKLQQFFRDKPQQPQVDDNWLTWWSSREMYGKQALEYIPVYNIQTNRAIFDQLLNDRDFGSVEQYDPTTLSWTFVAVFFSENYMEILPILALLKNLATYQDEADHGVAFIYDFCWGNSNVMAYLEFSKRQALLTNYTETTQIAPEVLNEANQTLEAVINKFNKQFED